ncbi:MAG: hypothetical protein JWR26_1759 [Pedosphaera sp.]|nr:hypothetical protein [Pedosphaera sp.]
MKRKPNSSSILHGLTPEQRERVDLWLFEENVSYDEVADRRRKIMEVKLSRSSVRRYYERECFNRKLEGIGSPAGNLKRMATTLGKHREEEYSIAAGVAEGIRAGMWGETGCSLVCDCFQGKTWFERVVVASCIMAVVTCKLSAWGTQYNSQS